MLDWIRKLLDWWVGYKRIPPPPPITFDNPEPPSEPVVITSYELPSPKIRIKPSDVTLRQEDDGTVTILIKGFKRGTVTTTVENTGSMEQGIDDGMQIILEPLSADNYQDIIVGDVIAYQAPTSQLILHRIVDIGADIDGWYCETRGDSPLITNNDPWLIRPAWLRWLYRGVVH